MALRALPAIGDLPRSEDAHLPQPCCFGRREGLSSVGEAIATEGGSLRLVVTMEGMIYRVRQGKDCRRFLARFWLASADLPETRASGPGAPIAAIASAVSAAAAPITQSPSVVAYSAPASSSNLFTSASYSGSSATTRLDLLR